MAPGLAIASHDQQVAGVRVRRLTETPTHFALPDVVIEGFGCGLPAPYLEAMAAAPRAPVWISLEYLSAEPWVDSAHGLPSPQPRLPLTRHFYFPGFTAGTGGLMRERGLASERDRAQADVAARASMLRSFGAGTAGPQALVVSLFCYPNLALPALLDTWTEGDAPVVCLVPDGVAAAALDAWTGGAVPHAGQGARPRRAHPVAAIPFVEQDAYDRMLWRCGPQLCPGGRLVRPGPMGGAAFRLAHLPAGRRRASREAGRISWSGSEAASARPRFLRLAAFWHAWNEGDTAPRPRRPGPPFAPRSPRSGRTAAHGPSASKPFPTSPASWSDLPAIGYNFGFPGERSGPIHRPRPPGITGGAAPDRRGKTS